MCGRFGFISLENREGQSSWYRLLDDEGGNRKDQIIKEIPTRYDVRPTQMVPIIKNNENGKHCLSMLRWGFHPVWSKGPIINTRVEKLFVSRFWKQMALKKRCVIPASFFYEWKEEGKQKIPYLIRKKENTDILFAGIWDHEKDLKTGGDVTSFSILTQDGNDLMREVHNSGSNKHRQPVFIDEKYIDKWLNCEVENEDDILSLIHTYDSSQIEVVRLTKIGDDNNHLPPEAVK